MGSGNAKPVEKVRVSRTKGRYPPPSPPKWFLPEICNFVKPQVQEENNEARVIDWQALELTLEAEAEDGKDPTNNTYMAGTRPDSVHSTPRPHSVLATPRINSGIWSLKQRNRVGRRPYVNFQRIEEHAKQATSKDAATFESLVTFLSEPIRKTKYPNTYLVRAITIWLTNQNLKPSKYRPANIDNPAGLLQSYRNNAISFTEVFTLICRAAGIPTVIIPGYVKAGKYESGDLIGEGAFDTWCAVHVDGSWQLIHPLWACLGVYGPARNGKVQIDDDPNLAAKYEKLAKIDKNAVIMNDEFFMPRPDVFIFRCFGKSTEWHLIEEKKTLKSVDEFTRLAYISPSFFKFGLSLLSQPYCVQQAINGVIQIEILSPSHLAHKLNMGFVFEYEPVEQDSSEQHLFKPSKQQCLLLHKKVLSKMVINYRSNDRFMFEVRLPLPGSYKFFVTGGIGTEVCILCKFKLISADYLCEWFVNPIDAGIDGWGPGPIAESVGLLLPSKPSGLLVIQPKCNSGVLRERSVYHHLSTINFKIDRALYRKYDFSAEIKPSIFIDENNIDTIVTTNGEVKTNYDSKKNSGMVLEDESFPVRVQLGKDHATRQITLQVIGQLDGGECALVIKATEMETKNSMRVPKKNTTKPVCIYLLTANTAFLRMPTEMKLARSELQEVMDTEDISKIQFAITKCIRSKIPESDDEIAAAEAKLDYLKLKKEIIDCVKRRNVTVVTDVLRKITGYRYREALTVEVEKLILFRSELQGLQGHTQHLPTLREATEELYKLTSPTEPVHNTIKALCLFLGYEGNLNDWTYIHTIIKVTQNKPNEMTLLRRIDYMEDSNFPWQNMDINVLDKVNTKLHQYTYEHVNYVSQAAAAVYKWVDAMLLIAKDALRRKLTDGSSG